MKSTITKFMLASLMSVTLSAMAADEAAVETTTTTQTTTSGTISEFTPASETMIVKSTSAAEPIRYRFSKRTVYVDEAGAPVSVELVKSGLPVTVHYVREGDALVASRVIVRKVATVPAAPTVIEKSTTTTTTKKTDDDDDDND